MWGKRLLWRVLASHLWWLEGEVYARTTFGSVLRVDASDIVGRYIYYFGVWEPNLTAWLQRTLKSGDIFVDVGANVGYFTVLASRLVGPTGGVVAIEALSDIHTTLEANVALNDGANVRTVQAAAWDTEGLLDMFTRQAGPSGTSTVYASWANRWDLTPAEKVVARPLPAILHADELARTRVIKIDAEGAEWRIITGLAEALASCRPDIELVVEVAPGLLQEENASVDDIASLLQAHGFAPYRLENDYEPSTYYGRGMPLRPVRLTDFPADLEQYDIIFSRSDRLVL